MTDRRHTSLEHDLAMAIEEMQAALNRAQVATAALRTLVPRTGELNALFEELDAVVRSGRARLSAEANGHAAMHPSGAADYSRPTLVVPGHAEPERPDAPAIAWRAMTAEATPTPAPPQLTASSSCFRIALESASGSLDLRAVDDAVTDTPCVVDVALLDFDGRRATLKVWADESASVADVRRTLEANVRARLRPETSFTIDVAA